jgi:hypothetical protein
VSGVDTVRGIAYQQAHAILVALDVLDSDDLGSLRVEGIDDVVDIEVFGTDGALRAGKQLKTRGSEYTWGKAKLLEVFSRWAALPGASAASFEFITDGRLGPTGQKVASGQAGIVMAVAGWPATVITNLVTVSLLIAALPMYQTFPSLLSVIQLPPTTVVPFRSNASIAHGVFKGMPVT